ncbi:MAG: 50S ribosomal protein L18Ae [Candidatus Burarchaeum sp.]|nr:50S ribosomal protein L18Ae [Candidatus Burarchaeum sp.]MDO8339458.1 50S ribosomal protein L18Ae [Candidatus Burarchaeum sp.]
MVKFLVKGKMRLGRGVKLELRPFKHEFEATSESRARELAYTFFGSNSGLKRSAVVIESIAKA